MERIVSPAQPVGQARTDARAEYNPPVPPILKVAPGPSSEEEGLDFELAYQRSLSTAQRFEMMLSR
jgi:hypothetical protein